MKSNRKKKRFQVHSQLALDSMTDIVFILLLFFVIFSSSAQKTINDTIKINLPKSSSTSKALPSLHVVVNREGMIYLDGRVVSLAQLEERFLTPIDNNCSRLIINADKDTKLENVVAVANIAKQYKYQISIATKN